MYTVVWNGMCVQPDVGAINPMTPSLLFTEGWLVPKLTGGPGLHVCAGSQLMHIPNT